MSPFSSFNVTNSRDSLYILKYKYASSGKSVPAFFFESPDKSKKRKIEAAPTVAEPI